MPKIMPENAYSNNNLIVPRACKLMFYISKVMSETSEVMFNTSVFMSETSGKNK
jgi:hypothetical protein